MNRTVIDVAFDLNMADDPEWANADDEARFALVIRWENRLTEAADRVGVSVHFLAVGSPEAYEWSKGLSGQDYEATFDLAARLWDEAR